MTSLRGGAYSKGIYYGRWSVRHTNFAATLRQEWAYSEGGAYMLVYTVSAKDRISAMAFATLYPIGQADFNVPRIQKVDLNGYTRHLMCFHDVRFGRHPRRRFFVDCLLCHGQDGC
jgi:hypothetical protein